MAFLKVQGYNIDQENRSIQKSWLPKNKNKTKIIIILAAFVLWTYMSIRNIGPMGYIINVHRRVGERIARNGIALFVIFNQ